MSNSVLPDPAGACTMNERSRASTASRTSWSTTCGLGDALFIVTSRGGFVVNSSEADLRHAAEAVQMTVPARAAVAERPLGIDRRLARHEILRQVLQRPLPAMDKLLPAASIQVTLEVVTANPKYGQRIAVAF